MLRNINEQTWRRYLEKYPRLRELAIKAGIEDNFLRAKELSGCFAFNGGKGVVRSEAEQELALYMFCIDDNNEDLKASIKGRMLAAKAAGVDEL